MSGLLSPHQQASSYSRWKLAQIPTIRQCAESETAEHRVLMDVCIIPFPSRLRDPRGKRGRKTVRPRGDDSEETGFFKHTQCPQELTETGQHARDPRRFQADTVSAERRESHPLTKKGLQLRAARRRKAVFCSGVTLGVSSPLRVGCMLVSSRPTQNTLYAFLSFLSL